MLYINQNQVNTLTLSINQNSRNFFTTYTLIFTHVMSSEVKEYVIDLFNPNVYFFNVRYCTIQLDLTGDNNLPYEGQYTLQIIGEPNSVSLYNGFCMVDGSVETNPFTEYLSPNETNENYIYIQD